MSKKIKLCIAGDRKLEDTNLVAEAIAHFKLEGTIAEVVSGKAQGGDKLGEEWAEANNIPVKGFPANWNDITVPNAKIKENQWGKKYNAMAGFNRNQDMADYADAVLALQPDGDTNGTKDCIERFTKAKKPTYIFTNKHYSQTKDDVVPF